MYGSASFREPPPAPSKPCTHSGIKCPKAKLKNTPPLKAFAKDNPSLFSEIFLERSGTNQQTTLIVVNMAWKMIFHKFNGMP
mmetsp:Transcript_14098/g.30088  ORF Transcript_14098/g.30088 Transcript_14098/m.30088 type:complete len:82 (-) Transcript_14098:361-606(-)